MATRHTICSTSPIHDGSLSHSPSYASENITVEVELTKWNLWDLRPSLLAVYKADALSQITLMETSGRHICNDSKMI